MALNQPSVHFAHTPPELSLVVPLRVEEGAIDALVASIAAALGPCATGFCWSTTARPDRTRAKSLALAARDARIRVLGHPVSAGQSAALRSGVLAARAAVVVTLDGDGQNPPENLSRLIAPLIGPEADPGCGLVAGQRVRRQDSLSKRLASQVANRLRSAILQDGTRDTGCGLKAFRRDAFLGLPYFNHMHRYLPALFARDGWLVHLVDVSHAPRKTNQSKYGNLDSALAGIFDLAGVAWLIRRRKRVKAALLTPEPVADRVFAKAEAAFAPEGTVDA